MENKSAFNKKQMRSMVVHLPVSNESFLMHLRDCFLTGGNSESCLLTLTTFRSNCDFIVYI